VAEWTSKAMNGNVKFEDALAARLELIQPSRNDISSCLAAHPPKLTPGITELVDALHVRGSVVYLVSGGFRLMIEPVADQLGIPHDRIYANTILFNSDGSYRGFDAAEPTSADGGKPAVIQRLKDAHGYTPIVMIGDGATDMQAKPPADAFIGFGGVVVRESVKDGADLFISDFGDITEVVKEGALMKN
jgi:phosphoserine phosphatase